MLSKAFNDLKGHTYLKPLYLQEVSKCVTQRSSTSPQSNINLFTCSANKPGLVSCVLTNAIKARA